MKFIESINSDGLKERWAVQDDDPEEDVKEVGIYVGVPDMSEMDWDGLRVRMHNALHDAKIFTSDDLTAKGGAVKALVCVEVVRELAKLYGV